MEGVHVGLKPCRRLEKPFPAEEQSREWLFCFPGMKRHRMDNETRRQDMIKTKKLALYGHGICGSDFYTEINEERSMKYTGTCPNPSCNRRVVLAPKDLFPSTDKARRAYIREAKSGRNFIFWQV